MSAESDGAKMIAKFAKQLAGGKVTKLTPELREAAKKDPSVLDRISQYMKEHGEELERGEGKTGGKAEGKVGSKADGAESKESAGNDGSEKETGNDTKKDSKGEAKGSEAKGSESQQPKSINDWWHDRSVKKDNKILSRKDEIERHELAQDLSARQWKSRLRIPKAIFGSKLGKIATWGTLGSYLLTGNLAIPMAVLHGATSLLGGALGGLTGSAAKSMAGMSILGGLGASLVKPIEHANKVVDKADQHVQAHNPYGSSQASYAKAQYDAINNSADPQDAQQGQQIQNEANHTVGKDNSGPEMS